MHIVIMSYSWSKDIVGKWDGATGNQPKECIKGVSKEQNETKLNYI